MDSQIEKDTGNFNSQSHGLDEDQRYDEPTMP